MPVHIFTLVLNRRPTDTNLDKLTASGTTDATFGSERGVPVVEFDREAPSLAAAVASAVRDLDAAGMTAVRVIDGDLLTLADIAARVGQSRESVRRYVTGERGPGGFPSPVNPGREGAAFYRWSEVSPWLRTHLGVNVDDRDPALVLANLIVQARQLTGRVDRPEALVDLLSS